MDTLELPPARHAAALNRLSRALDVPVEEFRDEPSDSDVSNLLALVQLWSEIEDREGRSRVLSVARQEAERGGYKGSA
ncbi:hypothetical protein [Methylobacterium brachiatum]|jgi:hypothetical protein|uniref:Uncharacterized protein n=1 Tax=Methylobacterium brachiatum TaxID=269660 RepID=A0ABV1RAZ5_9HYPH